MPRGHYRRRDLAFKLIALSKEFVEKILHLYRHEKTPCAKSPDNRVSGLHFFHNLQEGWLGFGWIGGKLCSNYIHKLKIVIEKLC